ncbi:uncharacterized protein K489DRAFT_195575 [Dissoconium aciculare CBS 342.82]|uniref:Uncharacterized protein n=1 Tax=Dissoconium aciculare CBS 342.82 TaxID=1314786 RepID=A0A6J3M9C2_9PEZI|nr:uncharacterized protein K489DRAFT_195575 [Dissoconium aciculare CBS 342.82]KAF1823412.1 hypothetical protein K489DRAFT_195575 [Dissoconium aciculare CBS 342.82]
MDSDMARPVKRRKLVDANIRCPLDIPCDIQNEHTTSEAPALLPTAHTGPSTTSDAVITTTSTAVELVQVTSTALVNGGALPVLQSALTAIENNVTSIADVAISAVTAAIPTVSLSIEISIGNTTTYAAPSVTPTLTSSFASDNTTSTAATTTTGFSPATITSSTGNSTTSTGTRGKSSLPPQTTSRPNATTTAPVLFYITLPNGEVRTLTESRSSYTTLIDGRTYTIPGLSDSTLLLTATSSDDAFSIATATSSEADSNTVEETSTPVVVPAGAGWTGGHGGIPANTGVATTSSGSPPANTSPPAPIAPPGTIAGGVVGGAAGLAVIVFIAMLFMRWYRRRDQFSGHQHLPSSNGGGSTMSRGFLDDGPDDGSAAGQRYNMSERAGVMPLVGALPALFRHPHRSLASTTSSTGSPATSERGFTRVSGRKLPSQFSPGMSSSEPLPPAAPPLLLDTSFTAAPVIGATIAAPTNALRKSPTARPTVPKHNPFSSSRDSTGLLSANGDYEDDHSDAEDPARRNSSLPHGHDNPAIFPGPQRQATLHEGSPYILTTPHGSEIAFANDEGAEPTLSPRNRHPASPPLPSAAGTPSSSPSNNLSSKASADSSFYRASLTPTLMSSSSSYYDDSQSMMTVTAGSLSRAGSNRTSRFTEEM